MYTAVSYTHLLKADMDRLENEQQAILDKYQIEDIHELMEKSQNQRSRQDVVLRLRRELEQLRKRYDAVSYTHLWPEKDIYGILDKTIAVRAVGASGT